MSFNPNDNAPFNLSRNNYEEYFLLYADNELSQEERLLVEQFVLVHPDLKQELDLLLGTKLPLEDISLENKENLLAESMKLNAIDEDLLLYLDDELNEAGKRQVEAKLKSDKAYQLQYNALLQTKPDRPEAISYPYKKELYRHEVRRTVSFYWVRIAAAIIILIGMGIFVFVNQQQPAAPDKDTASVKARKTQPAIVETKTVNPIVIEKTTSPQPPIAKADKTGDAPAVVRHIKKKAREKEIKKPIITPVENTPQITVRDEQPRREENNAIVRSKPELPSQQTINKDNVTSSAIGSYNNQTTSAITAVHTDVAKTENEKKSTLKGFLRKATRFIERRTNISTTNENDELLIGAVSVKL